MAEADHSEIALKYMRFSRPDWMGCETVEEAISTAYWMIEDNNGAPTEVVTLDGLVLLNEQELAAKIGDYDAHRLVPTPQPMPPPIPGPDLTAALAFSKFMGQHSASAEDWTALAENVREVWRAKVSAAK